MLSERKRACGVTARVRSQMPTPIHVVSGLSGDTMCVVEVDLAWNVRRLKALIEDAKKYV